MSFISSLRRRNWIGDKSFYKELIILMLPIIFQQLVNTLFTFTDNLMVGMVNEQTLSGVTVANRYSFFYNAIVFGVSGGAGVLISQYFGAQDYRHCQRVFAFELLSALFLTLIYVFLLILFPLPLMRVFVKDPDILQAGYEYLVIVRYSYIASCISTICLFSLRYLGSTTFPMLVSFASIFCNVVLNYILIFGKCGFPALGGRGAAIATLITRIVEMTFYLGIIGSKKTIFSLDLKAAFELTKEDFKDFFDKAIPLTANELLWSLSNSVIFWCYARVNEAALASIAIVEQTNNLMFILFTGMASAVSIYIGKCLGANDLAGAKANSKKLLFFVGVISVFVGGIAFFASDLIPLPFQVSPALRVLAGEMIRVQSLLCFLNVQYVALFFIFRAGGDTRSNFILDSVYNWVFPIPVSLLLSLWLVKIYPMSITTVFTITQIVVFLKIIPSYYLYKKERWLKNITREHR